jgi:hypothetical protein
MCCAYGTGIYSLNSSTGAVLATGGDFASSEATAFCVNAPVSGCDPSNFVNAPTGMNAGFSASQLTLSWNAYANSTRCTLQGNRTAAANNGTFNAGSFTGTVAPTQRNFPLSQLVAGDEYRWRLRCSCREDGVTVNSPYSAWQYFTAPGSVVNDGSSFLESSTKSLISLENLYIYPNPAQGELNIRWSGASDVTLNVEVLDMTGKVVIESELDTQKSNTYRMDIQNLESGMYFIRLSDGTSQVLQRWVKQ